MHADTKCNEFFLWASLPYILAQLADTFTSSSRKKGFRRLRRRQIPIKHPAQCIILTGVSPLKSYCFLVNIFSIEIYRNSYNKLFWILNKF